MSYCDLGSVGVPQTCHNESVSGGVLARFMMDIVAPVVG